MSTKKGVENGKKKKNVETGLRVECSLHERESGETFIPVVYDNFLLLEGFCFAFADVDSVNRLQLQRPFAVMLTVLTDYNHRGVSNDSVS